MTWSRTWTKFSRNKSRTWNGTKTAIPYLFPLSGILGRLRDVSDGIIVCLLDISSQVLQAAGLNFGTKHNCSCLGMAIVRTVMQANELKQTSTWNKHGIDDPKGV